MDAAAASRVDAGARAGAQATARLERGAQASARASARLQERPRALLAQAVGEAGRAQGSRAAAALPSVDEPGVGARPGAFPGPDAAPDSAQPPVKASPPPPTDAVGRAMELVERVEAFLRSGMPSLALTLRGAMAGRVEVQRVAAGTVSLRLESERPPAASELAAMETALRARGLTVQAMEILPLSPAAD